MNKEIDITGVVLTTNRLTLRPWKESDLNDFYEYARVDGVGQMAGWSPHRNMEESRTILSHFIQGKHVFALEHQGKVIGSLGVEKYNEENYPELAALQGREIGYVLSRDYWGQGLMPEAVQAVIAYLFDTVDLDFLLVGHFDPKFCLKLSYTQQVSGFLSPITWRYSKKLGDYRTICDRTPLKFCTHN